jgi:hypothetical protein
MTVQTVQEVPSFLRDSPPKLLHPAFEVSEEHAIISFGFSIGGGDDRATVHVVSDGRKVKASEADSFGVGQTKLRFRSAKLLADLDL